MIVPADTTAGDIPEKFEPSLIDADHERREVKVPMRDGVKLHTVIILPKGVTNAPVILDRTPYGASELTKQSGSSHGASALHALHGDLFTSGYILAVQDVRGKYESEGVYVMNLPLRGEFNRTETDHSTDAWDTVAWLVDHLPECNGKVGALGLSYDGFTALMNLTNPHPSLTACVAINPMVDGWIGDDWFRNGAFRQLPAAHYIHRQTTTKGSGPAWPSPAYDEFEAWLNAGSAHEMAERVGITELPAWQRLESHPDYDSYWQAHALDRALAAQGTSVPTLHVHSQWDAEDPYGSIAVYEALEPTLGTEEKNHLVIGPWSHACPFYTGGAALGALKFGSDTARWFRRHILLPFLDSLLREGARTATIPKVTVFETGSNEWHEHSAWPPKSAHETALYLASDFTLGFEPPQHSGELFDEWVSDPAKPVTHHPRPIVRKCAPGFAWERWLVGDQRFAGDRPDVMTYTSDVLTSPLRLAGQPVVRLFASTTGTDADWIVKLIDVYPDEVPFDEEMGSYQLPIAMEAFRGRYHASRDRATALPSGRVVEYEIKMPHVCHTVLPGHRLMVQIQSTLFPLIDRNPQTFVPNIFFAQPSDYAKATHRLNRSADAPSRIVLPVI